TDGGFQRERHAWPASDDRAVHRLADRLLDGSDATHGDRLDTAVEGPQLAVEHVLTLGVQLFDVDVVVLRESGGQRPGVFAPDADRDARQPGDVHAGHVESGA